MHLRPTSSNNLLFQPPSRPFSSKPSITFSYAPPKMQAVCVPVLPRVQSALPLLQPGYSDFKSKVGAVQAVPIREHISVVDAEGRRRSRKKIFENRSSGYLGLFSASNQQKQNRSTYANDNRVFSHISSQNESHRKRKLIFDMEQPVKSASNYNPFLNGNVFLPNNTFPLGLSSPKHPDNLVQYVSLTPRRKNRSTSPLEPSKKMESLERNRTYQIILNKNVKAKQMKDSSSILPKSTQFQKTPSVTNIGQEEESVISYSCVETNRSSEDLRELLQQTEGQRFYDNESERKMKGEKPESYIDVRMAQSNKSCNWNTVQQQVPCAPASSSSLIDRASQIYHEVAHHKLTVPILLVLLGVLLLVIQSLK